MKLLIKNTNLTLRIIGWFQVIGGLLGLILLIRFLPKVETMTGAILLLTLTGIGLFSFSIYAGKSLLTNVNKNPGIIFSIINQVLQIFQWEMFGYGISYNSGFDATVGFGIEEQTYLFLYGINFSIIRLSINQGSEFFIKIDVLALTLALILLYILKQSKHNTQDQHGYPNSTTANKMYKS